MAGLYRRISCGGTGRGLWQIPVWLTGDINADGVANALDIPPFVSVLLDQPADADTRFRCDANGDGAADGEDIAALVDVLLQ